MPPLRIFRRTDADPGSGTATIVDAECVICGGPSGEVLACCSPACVREAEREVSANIMRLRRLRGTGPRSERARLTARNGELTSAMLRWRPDGLA